METFLFNFGLAALPTEGLARMPLLVTGSWVKGGRDVSFSREELDLAIANFNKLANRDLNVDYDHACEDLKRAAGEPTPSAGRILSIDPPEPFDADPSRWILFGRYEPTAKAKELIKNREYRYTSVAFAKEYPDRKTGESQGLTLTSVALTNQPFLDELPEVRLSVDGTTFALTVSKLSNDRHSAEGGKQMDPSLTLKRTADGKHEAFDGEKRIGVIGDEMLRQYATTIGLLAMAVDTEKLSTAAVTTFTREIGAEGKSKEEIRGLVALAQNPPKAEVTLLNECIGDNGKFDVVKFNAGCDSNIITRGAERRGREAEARVERALLSGHLTPAMIATGAPLRLALSDAAAFKTLVEERAAIVKPNVTTGIGGTGAESGESPRQLFSRLVEEKKRQLMSTDSRLSELEAHRRAGALVSKENPDLLKDYRSDAKSA